MKRLVMQSFFIKGTFYAFPR